MRDKREKGWFWVENELVDNEELKPMERLLYMVLARHSNNETGESFPSLETLCKKTGVKDKRTIVNHLKNLESLELIEIKKQMGISNRYYLKNVKSELVTKNDTSNKICNEPLTKNDTRPVTKIVPLTRLNNKTKKQYLVEDENLKIDYEKIRLFWNENTNLPSIKILSNKRKEKIKLRIQEVEEKNFLLAINKLNYSDFATGKNNSSWKADIDWLITNDTNIVKVLEGKYDNKIGANIKKVSMKGLEPDYTAY